jgi:LysR family transcriptional regulator, glycine cleavage system transcriptional activator
MHTPPARLPPLSALRAFEAAARRQSFKAAAEELSLTPTAVSSRDRCVRCG